MLSGDFGADACEADRCDWDSLFGGKRIQGAGWRDDCTLGLPISLFFVALPPQAAHVRKVRRWKSN